ncbi:Glycosyl hydrolase family 71 [Geosmithia morbida]|uniref:Glycosyl hydrolase family 71 n=1 Tax=Geosmithia morbida TaxID=1094350 RepID=A0A9P5D7H3_9HYPO|nr:Glycosyl hydrolase family 71 [Geosmithia morbida]KAF4124519.1 Glycosyl hydrolase family 71 [Geosmithia morbida]
MIGCVSIQHLPTHRHHSDFPGHAQQDIDDAKNLSINAFVLELSDAALDMVTGSPDHLFTHPGFFNGSDDYQWTWGKDKASSSYYKVDGKALISTFSSGGFDSDR